MLAPFINLFIRLGISPDVVTLVDGPDAVDAPECENHSQHYS